MNATDLAATELAATHGAAAAAPRQRGSIPNRVLDVVVAAALLFVLAPLLLVVAGAIRLDSSGPALFKQIRLGRGGRRFTVLKFRTMRTDADPALHHDYVRTLIQSEPTPVGEQGLYKLAVDDRITRVGHFLRIWSLDELPQLLNVLRGEMSLVGPRPVIPYEVDLYPGWYLRRFQVKPGMTGHWQVSGRNHTTYEQMVELDLEYVDRKTLLMDLVILFKTPFVVMRRIGAA